jgi:hypothetical protein
MMSMSLSARWSPGARTEQGGVRHAARSKRGLVLAQTGDDRVPVHDREPIGNPSSRVAKL